MEFLKWKYTDIVNEFFFRGELARIPSAFDSCEAWRCNLRPFIFEDLRATLHAALQKYSNNIKRSRVKLSAGSANILREMQRDFCDGTISIEITFDQSEKLDGADLNESIAVLVRYLCV